MSEHIVQNTQISATSAELTRGLFVMCHHRVTSATKVSDEKQSRNNRTGQWVPWYDKTSSGYDSRKVKLTFWVDDRFWRKQRQITYQNSVACALELYDSDQATDALRFNTYLGSVFTLAILCNGTPISTQQKITNRCGEPHPKFSYITFG